MLVSDWMTPAPLTVPRDTPVLEALRLLKARGFRRLPVVDGAKLIGIVTDKDLKDAMPSKATTLSIWELNYLLAKLTVADVMAKPVKSCRSTDTLEAAALIMQDAKVAGLPVLDASGPTRLHELLAAAAHTVRQRSTVFVVSDFVCEPGWSQPLAQLAQRHDVVAVRLLAPLEQALPDLGLIPMRDAETGEQLMVDTHNPGFRRRFAQIAAEREAGLRSDLARAGVDTLELSTNDDLLEALLRFVDLRKRRKQVSRHRLPAHLKLAA